MDVLNERREVIRKNHERSEDATSALHPIAPRQQGFEDRIEGYRVNPRYWRCSELTPMVWRQLVQCVKKIPGM